MYFVAFGGIIIGLVTYNVRPPPAAPPRNKNKKMRIENGDPSSDKSKQWTESAFKPQENGNAIYFYGNGHINSATIDDNINMNSSLVNNRTGPNGHYSGL